MPLHSPAFLTVGNSTGTGLVVRQTSPTLVTPALGVATGTSFAATSTVTGSALIPTGSTVPANGVFLPAANTLGFSSNTTQRAQFDSSGRLLINATTAQLCAGVTALVQQHGNSSGQGGGSFNLTYWQNNATGAAMFLNKSRSGTVGSFTVIQSGDELATLYFGGDDGTAILKGASISAVVDAAPGTNDLPTRLVFSTTADGASSPTERLRIDSTGLATFTGAVKTLSTTVASLPSASTAGSGARAFVTDATATTFLSTVVGGGSNKVPVVSDGTNWKIG